MTHCGRCGARSPVRLAPDQACAACRSAEAWARADRLVITREEIATSVARRRSGPRRPVLPALVALAGLALASVAGFYLIALFEDQPLRGLDGIFAAVRSAATGATLAGGGALLLGAVALWRLGKGAHAHRRLLLAGHALAILAGGVAGAIGAVHWLAIAQSSTMAHLTMPALELASQPSLHMERIARATVVILAPDAEGDARTPGIGSGVVVGRSDGKAWIATCLHVAMPYVSPAAERRLEEAHPVWVQLFDGRHALGRVVLAAPPPLDIALVEIAVDAPPEPVAIARDVSEVAAGDSVMFVPNPYRSGWRIHHGDVALRRMHLTPAGAYSLVFTDLPVQPGDSGSGLFDGRGRLIGLNTWTRFDQGIPHGISLPTETLRAIEEALGRERLSVQDEQPLLEQPR